MAKRSYRQHCALARALDVLGERWTLLVVRELLTGPRRYSELLENLPGMGTNLLAARLKEMAAAGLITREEARYRLSDRGRELEEVVLALCRFGAPYLAEREPSDLWRPAWNVLALQYAFVPERGRDLSGTVEFRVGESVVQARFEAGRIETSGEQPWRPVAVLETDEATFLALVDGESTLEDAVEDGRVRVRGDAELLAASVAAFDLPGAAPTA